MTNEAFKEKNIQRLKALSKSNKAFSPPRCREPMSALFDVYFGAFDRREPECFMRYLQKHDRTLREKDREALAAYFEEARIFLLEICCAFAGIYQSYSALIGGYGDCQEYYELLMKACLTRYPWLTSEWVAGYLHKVCWLCNR